MASCYARRLMVSDAASRCLYRPFEGLQEYRGQSRRARKKYARPAPNTQPPTPNTRHPIPTLHTTPYTQKVLKSPRCKGWKATALDGQEVHRFASIVGMSRLKRHALQACHGRIASISCLTLHARDASRRCANGKHACFGTREGLSLVSSCLPPCACLLLRSCALHCA
jgi:hypothetical protein